MANYKQLAILRRGARYWNAWRADHGDVRADLSEADLSGANLRGAKLNRADLSGARLIRTNLSDADLSDANLRGADLHRANLSRATLIATNLCEANLSEVKLFAVSLFAAKLTEADLTKADLRYASLVRARLERAKLLDCNVYGVSAWDVRLAGTVQSNLVISPPNSPRITVDNLEVAQFLYLMLHNESISRAIDTLTSKVVLILGRFTEKRKPTLDALRKTLRTLPNDYVPVVFDFEPSRNADILHSVTLLARMARFVIADITDPAMVRTELVVLVRDLPSVAFQPLLQEDGTPFVEWETIQMYRNVLDIYYYTDVAELLDALSDEVIVPAEAKVRELRALRLKGRRVRSDRARSPRHP